MLKKAALCMFLWMAFGFAHAKVCRESSKVCVDAVEPKQVSGVSVRFSDVGITDGCWQWDYTYDCVETTGEEIVDYCAPLEASGSCSTINVVCAKKSSVDDSCDTYTKTYRCGDPVTSATNVVVLDSSYTIVKDTVDYSTCDTYANNGSCALASETCTDPSKTKVVRPDGTTRDATPAEVTSGVSTEGLVTFSECWEWRRDYTCTAGQHKDYCQPLKTAGCTESTAPTCKSTAFDGTCIEYSRTYQCGTEVPPAENVIEVDRTYSVANDQTITTCANYETSPGCSKMGEQCVDGPTTKVIAPNGDTRAATDAEIQSGTSVDGAVVYKECWQKEMQYTCQTTESNCPRLKERSECAETGSACIDTNPDGACSVMQHTYTCQVSPDSTTTEKDCGTQMFCANGACFDTGYTGDQDLAKAVTLMEAAREAGSYELFAGESDKCEKKLWGFANCCEAKGGGKSYSNSRIASGMGVAVIKFGAEKIAQTGSAYLFDVLMRNGIDQLGEMAFQATGAVMSASMNEPVLGAYGFTIQGAGAAGTGVMGATTQLAAVPGTNMYIYFNPYMLAAAVFIQLVMDYMSCEEPEMKLGLKRGAGLCHLVGSYCSNKILGSCETKTESWCCFPSKLARIINEQGRAQVEKTWGTAKAPDCTGFTTDQLMMMRFDQMDLTDFYGDILVPAKSADFAATRIQERAQQPQPSSYYQLEPSMTDGTMSSGL